MDHIRGHLLLFLAVVVGSAIPFVPTGEMVSGSSALAAHSQLSIFLIFVVTWVASVIGDTLLLFEVRLSARKLRPWLARRGYSGRVQQARDKLHRNAFSGVVAGRLVPGGRAPVIIALGLGQFSFRWFVLFDAVACAMWAFIYSMIGSVGGRIADHPVWGMVIAVAFAVSISVFAQRLIRFAQWLRARAGGGRPPQASQPQTRPADRLARYSASRPERRATRAPGPIATMTTTRTSRNGHRADEHPWMVSGFWHKLRDG